MNTIASVGKNNNMLCVMYNFLSCRFSAEEVSAQNQVKASVQRKIRQSIADEVWIVDALGFLFFCFHSI